MSRFVFRLETVLRLRRRDEDGARARLASALAEVERQRVVLRELEEERDGMAREQGMARTGEVWAQGQMVYLDWRLGMVRRIQARTESLARAQEAAEAARTALVEARRAVQVLEKLRERRLEQWKLDRRRSEQATLSDIAAQRWLRGQA